MITIVSFQAFNKPNREIFLRGESFEQIHETLFSICSSYLVTEILQGDLQNIELTELEKFKGNSNKFKTNEIEKHVLTEALEDYKNKARQFAEVIKVGFDNSTDLEKSFFHKIEAATTLQSKLKSNV